MVVQLAAVVHVGGIVLPVMAQPGSLTPVSVTQEKPLGHCAPESPDAPLELPELLPLLLPFPPLLLELELLPPLPLEEPVPPLLELLLEDDDSASSLPPPELLFPKPVLPPPLLLEQPTTIERPATTITDTDLSIVTLRGAGSMSERARQGNMGATPSNGGADAGKRGVAPGPRAPAP
jgi:hypothetical protein